MATEVHPHATRRRWWLRDTTQRQRRCTVRPQTVNGPGWRSGRTGGTTACALSHAAAVIYCLLCTERARPGSVVFMTCQCRAHHAAEPSRFADFGIRFGFGRRREPWPTCRCAWRCARTADTERAPSPTGIHARALKVAPRLRVLSGAHGVPSGLYRYRGDTHGIVCSGQHSSAVGRIRKCRYASVQGLELLVTVLLARNRQPPSTVAAGVLHANLAAELVSLPSGLLAMVCEAIVKLKVRLGAAGARASVGGGTVCGVLEV
jgi:hypothetical protein